MTNLLTVGDRVEIGRYVLFSRFSKTLLFMRETQPQGKAGTQSLAFLVEDGRGHGPINMVLSTFDFSRAEDLEVLRDRVVMNGIPWKITQRYNSTLHLGPAEPNKIAANVQTLELSLRTSAPAKNLAFLLDDRRIPPTSAFEKELRRRLRGGVERLIAGDRKGGTEAIKRLGRGLTPSGDDLRRRVARLEDPRQNRSSGRDDED